VEAGVGPADQIDVLVAGASGEQIGDVFQHATRGQR
jgi:hypothetical protein